MARPCKLTPEVTKRICDAIRAGAFSESAAAFAGISRRTYQRWCAKGRTARSGKFLKFADEITRAESEAEVSLAAMVRKGAVKDWRAASFLLERRYRDRWGKDLRVEVSGEITHRQSNVRIYELPAEEPDPVAVLGKALDGEIVNAAVATTKNGGS